jgi:hypothetical protein
MKETVIELGLILRKYEARLRQLDEEEFSEKPSPEKWSRKEELGHLIDSAHNNLRRFIVAQYAWSPKIVYDQDSWVKIGRYQQINSNDLISLWYQLNKQIFEVLRSMPETSHGKFCDTGKEKAELHTLKWLAKDYLKHLLHHMHHILELEPVEYP